MIVYMLTLGSDDSLYVDMGLMIVYMLTLGSDDILYVDIRV